ncbi:MAG: reverse transcriptase domain-containing protein [Rubrivivax sp.]|nr:reverse transcriptase domain-containing protein [Rubrivivax sp.]
MTPLQEAAPGVPVSLAACHAAWLRARRGKRPSLSQLAFEARWLDRLQDLQAALRAGHWQPGRTVSFVVTHPKTREIHAPCFADRVVHHLLVERLEPLFEPVFIHDSFANRRGKGSHAAVQRLQAFMRARENMPPAGGGCFLQLDIHNFFNSIHRPTLYGLLCERLARAERRGDLPPAHALALRSLCHNLLVRRAAEQVRDARAAAAVPAHKRLRHAAPGCGLPVGNLTSQFFANVVLNPLDQFVKHTLKVRHYVRYVDDFVLLGESPEQLQQRQAEIEAFLHERLRLSLKDGSRLLPCASGIDFLGHVVFAHRRRVRPWVVRHGCARLQGWHQRCRAALRSHTLSAADFAQLQALLGSYWGHFAHADSVRLRRQLFARRPWLGELFDLAADGSLQAAAPALWQVRRHRRVRQILQPEGDWA